MRIFYRGSRCLVREARDVPEQAVMLHSIPPRRLPRVIPPEGAPLGARVLLFRGRVAAISRDSEKPIRCCAFPEGPGTPHAPATPALLRQLKDGRELVDRQPRSDSSIRMEPDLEHHDPRLAPDITGRTG